MIYMCVYIHGGIEQWVIKSFRLHCTVKSLDVYVLVIFNSWKENIQTSVHIKLYFFHWKPKVWQGYESQFCTPGWRWARIILPGRRLAGWLTLSGPLSWDSILLLSWSQYFLISAFLPAACFLTLPDSPYWHHKSIVFFYLFKEKQYSCCEKHIGTAKTAGGSRPSIPTGVPLG